MAESGFDMPEDVVFRILLWLPVVSLLRFKSVCKSWCSLIQSSDFITKHLLHKRHRPKGDTENLILLTRVKEQCSLVFVENYNYKQLRLPYIGDPFQLNSVNIEGYCNGIICLRQDRRICLWNPATNQSIKIPPIPDVPVGSMFFMGFGFDFQTDDYKLVCLSFCARDIILVYSVRSDSWKSIENVVLPAHYMVSHLKEPCHRNQVFCWLGLLDALEDYYYYYFHIVLFDFSKEVLETMLLPDSVNESHFKLSIIRDEIACICPQSCYLDVWLSEFGVKDSWSKLYVIAPFPVDWQWTVGFSNNGDFLSFRVHGQLCLYDLVNQKTINIPVEATHDLEAVVYEESLVTIKKGSSTVNNHTIQDQNAMVQSVTNSWCEIGVPEEIALHILLWLPVVSLLRFKAVCRSWYSLIKSSSFVDQHLCHHSCQKDDDISLIFLSPGPYRHQLFQDSSHPPGNVSCACLLSADKFELLDFPYHENWEDGSLKVAASCNGIICLKHTEDPNVYLWNPATKGFRALLKRSQFTSRGDAFSVGIGFDEKSNDYKLVKFSNQFDSDVEVYNLSTNNWRTMENAILPTFKEVFSGLKVPFQNAIFCWLGIQSSDLYGILTFDFSNELFGSIPLPERIETFSLIELATMRGNISFIYWGDELEGGYRCHEIWMLNGFGTEESWTKLYTIGPLSVDWYWLAVCSKNKDFALLLHDGQLYLWDLLTQERILFPTQVQVQGREHLGSGFDVVAYEESLLSV